jgi:hypothetical protein
MQKDGAIVITSSRRTALANQFTFAEPEEQGRQLRRADAEVRLGGRRRLTVADDLAQRDRRARDQALPDRLGSWIPPRYQDMCKAACPSRGKLVKGFLDYALSDGQSVAEGAPVTRRSRRRSTVPPRRRSPA